MQLSGENTMNFSKLPVEKRNKLILVGVGTLLVAGAFYSFVISPQNQNLVRLASKKLDVQASQRRVLDAVRRASAIEAELASARKALAEAEADIASGDLYSWVINTFRQFKAAYKVNIPQFSPLGAITEVNLLPNVPYKQASLSLAGTAHFHDLGRFLADLENQFPHFRVANLSLDLNPSPAPEDRETVSFRLDLITLVKTDPS
jgi:Tfp pilus assembly protein PilO